MLTFCYSCHSMWRTGFWAFARRKMERCFLTFLNFARFNDMVWLLLAAKISVPTSFPVLVTEAVLCVCMSGCQDWQSRPPEQTLFWKSGHVQESQQAHGDQFERTGKKGFPFLAYALIAERNLCNCPWEFVKKQNQRMEKRPRDRSSMYCIHDACEIPEQNPKKQWKSSEVHVLHTPDLRWPFPHVVIVPHCSFSLPSSVR